jgi:Flp pilus assembly protein TadD
VGDAVRYYEEALDSDPTDAYVHFAAGDLLRSLGQRERARQAFARSLELATEGGDMDLMRMASDAQAACDR